MLLDFGAFLDAEVSPEVYFGNIKTEDMEDDRIYTLVGKKGIFTTKKSGAIRVTKLEESYKDSTAKMLVRLDDVKTGLEVLVPKIPFKYYMQVLDYFREVHRVQGNEAGVTVFYRNERTDMDKVLELGGDGVILHDDFIIYCPVQENSPAIHIIEGEELYEYLLDNSTQVLELHSHHTMGIGWSGTDDANMKNFRQYTVFNHIERIGKTQTRSYFRGDFINFKDSDLFEIPFDMEDVLFKEEDGELKVLGSHEEEVDVSTSKIESLDLHPESWLDRSVRRVYVSSVKGESYKNNATDSEDYLGLYGYGNNYDYDYGFGEAEQEEGFKEDVSYWERLYGEDTETGYDYDYDYDYGYGYDNSYGYEDDLSNQEIGDLYESSELNPEQVWERLSKLEEEGKAINKGFENLFSSVGVGLEEYSNKEK